jgi:hypothetical protein
MGRSLDGQGAAWEVKVKVKVKVKHSHYRPMGPTGIWEVKASRFRDIGT